MIPRLPKNSNDFRYIGIYAAFQGRCPWTPQAFVPSGICVQYAEGFDEINEKTVRKIIKNVRKGTFQHLYLALDPDGESSFFQMVRQNGYAALAIGIATCVDNCVKWTSYLSYNSRYAASDEVSPIRYDQDIF